MCWKKLSLRTIFRETEVILSELFKNLFKKWNSIVQLDMETMDNIQFDKGKLY